MTDRLSYYGRPIVKEPVWKPEIPLYFFAGGMAGASASLSLGARMTGNRTLARASLYAAAVGVTVSPPLLIKDLGRPALFYNMLRVFKVTSPMSVGTWIVSAEGTATGFAAACELFGVMPRLKLAAQAVAGLLGPPMATYTGALVAQSVVPAWHEARQDLPLTFAAGSAASAGGAAAIFTPVAQAGPARRLAILGGVAELVSVEVMKKRVGKLVAESYHHGDAKKYSRLSELATLAGTALMARAGRRRTGAVTAGALLLGGALCERFAVYHAGKNSARDPHQTSIPQKERAAESGQPAISRVGNGVSPDASTR
jgi:formate-dependent nitrite reductase membrane component NrfD